MEQEITTRSNSVCGNDLALLGRKLNDTRIRTAFILGWMLTPYPSELDQPTTYQLIPPIHFECVRWRWASYQLTDIDGVQIGIPSYYHDDHVMRYGKTDDKVFNYIQGC